MPRLTQQERREIIRYLEAGILGGDAMMIVEVTI